MKKTECGDASRTDRSFKLSSNILVCIYSIGDADPEWIMAKMRFINYWIWNPELIETASAHNFELPTSTKSVSCQSLTVRGPLHAS